MHIKLEISTSLPTHRVARSIWIPEFYTLEEVAKVLQASLGWEEAYSYAFKSDDMSWLPCGQFEGEIIEDGQFLAEGTTLSEVVKFWEEGGASFQSGKREIWEFSLKVQDVRETHPDNMTCILLDGHGDMPVDHDDMRRIFMETHDRLIDDGGMVLGKTLRTKNLIEHSIGLCAELVSSSSFDISRARRLPQY